MTVCKAPGTNDPATYRPCVNSRRGSATPAAGTGDAGAAGAPPGGRSARPRRSTRTGTRAPRRVAGDIPTIQSTATGGRTKGQIVLTNGKNVGARAGYPSAPGALAPARVDNVQVRGQGLRLELVNTAAIRFIRLRLTDSGGTQVPLVRVGGEGGLLDNAVVEGGTPGAGSPTTTRARSCCRPASAPTSSRRSRLRRPACSRCGPRTISRTGMGFSNIPTVPVMHFKVTGTAASAYTISAGTPLRAATGDPVPVPRPPTGAPQPGHVRPAEARDRRRPTI